MNFFLLYDFVVSLTGFTTMYLLKSGHHRPWRDISQILNSEKQPIEVLCFFKLTEIFWSFWQITGYYFQRNQLHLLLISSIFYKLLGRPAKEINWIDYSPINPIRLEVAIGHELQETEKALTKMHFQNAKGIS